MAFHQVTQDVAIALVAGEELTGGDWTEYLNKIGKVFAAVSYGRQTVATGGTAEALNGGTSVTVPKGGELLIYAEDGNTGKVYVGDSDVTTSTGMPLDPKETMNIKIDDVAKIYIDADNNGDAVRWFVESD